MNETADFWCNECSESFPDSIQEEHARSHADEARSADQRPDTWALAVAAGSVAIGVIAGLLVLNL